MRQSKILVSPLDWGLGHASRCIPVIRMLVERGAEVIIATDGSPEIFLKAEFPRLEFIKLPGYRIKYQHNGGLVLRMLRSIPGILIAITREHSALKKIVKERGITGVISDNRFGLWHTSIYTVFITHQLFIQLPRGLGFLKVLINKINHYFIRKFDECWVPDHAGDLNLSGILSHGNTLSFNPLYIGPLSHFPDWVSKYEKHIDLLVILSGPEPQRTVFEDIIIKQLRGKLFNIFLIRGLSESEISHRKEDNITIINYLNSNALFELIHQSELILARSGYSTIMDLAATGARAILVPTPGQTEQEYLAKYHFASGHYYYETQENLNIERSIRKAGEYQGLKMPESERILEDTIKKILGD